MLQFKEQRLCAGGASPHLERGHQLNVLLHGSLLALALLTCTHTTHTHTGARRFDRRTACSWQDKHHRDTAARCRQPGGEGGGINFCLLGPQTTQHVLPDCLLMLARRRARDWDSRWPGGGGRQQFAGRIAAGNPRTCCFCQASHLALPACRGRARGRARSGLRASRLVQATADAAPPCTYITCMM